MPKRAGNVPNTNIKILLNEIKIEESETHWLAITYTSPQGKRPFARPIKNTLTRA